MTRATSSHRRPGLDVLRGIAITMVLIGHNVTWPAFRPELYEAVVSINNVGYLGVDVFFALSGFLIGSLLITEYQTRGRIDVWRFIVRRAFKIWPVLYAYLLTYVAALWMRGTPIAAIVDDVWPSFLHLQNFFPTESAHGHL